MIPLLRFSHKPHRHRRRSICRGANQLIGPAELEHEGHPYGSLDYKNSDGVWITTDGALCRGRISLCGQGVYLTARPASVDGLEREKRLPVVNGYLPSTYHCMRARQPELRVLFGRGRAQL